MKYLKMPIMSIKYVKEKMMKYVLQPLTNILIMLAYNRIIITITNILDAITANDWCVCS